VSLSPDDRRLAGKHALFAFLAVGVLVGGLVHINVDVPLIGHLGSALVAVTLLYAPVVVAWKRGEDLLDYGFHVDPVKRGLIFGAGFIVIVFPPFWWGYGRFYEIVCTHGWSWVNDLPQLAAQCKSWKGSWHWPHPTWDLAEFLAVQTVVVALPEELFFRGCLLELLERRFPPQRRIAGGGVGVALVLSSAAFAVVHLPRTGDPGMLATFFPGLVFGWMRSATRSILAPVMAHSASNVFAKICEQMWLT